MEQALSNLPVDYLKAEKREHSVCFMEARGRAQSAMLPLGSVKGAVESTFIDLGSLAPSRLSIILCPSFPTSEDGGFKEATKQNVHCMLPISRCHSCAGKPTLKISGM